MICVAPADVNNKYIAEGEKRLDALFIVARKNAAIIIFFG